MLIDLNKNEIILFVAAARTFLAVAEENQDSEALKVWAPLSDKFERILSRIPIEPLPSEGHRDAALNSDRGGGSSEGGAHG